MVFQHNPFAYPYFVCSIYILAMSFYVLSLNPRGKLNLVFQIQCLNAFCWQLGTFFALLAISQETGFIWGRIIYLGVIFISLSTYYFVVTLLNRTRQKRFAAWGYLIMGIIWIPLIFPGTSFFVGLYRYSWGPWFKAGPLHPLFLVTHTFWALLTFANLIYAMIKQADPWMKKKCKFLFYAYLVCYLGVLDYLPAYGWPVYPCSYIPIMIFLTAFAFAIHHYDLLDIDFKRCGDRPMSY